MNNYEDTILTVTYQITQSYYMFKQVGYYYSRDKWSGTKNFLIIYIIIWIIKRLKGKQYSMKLYQLIIMIFLIL